MLTDKELREAGVHEDALGAARAILFVFACYVLLGAAVLCMRMCG